MNRSGIKSAILILSFAAGAFSQTAVISSAGYSAPAPVPVAPGQVVNLYVRGIGLQPNGAPRFAPLTDPPAVVLAGISVQVIQQQMLFQAPILAVQQQNDCAQNASTDISCLLTTVRIQVPFEIQADVKPEASLSQFTLSPTARIILSAEERPSASLTVQPYPDRAHVLTTCDQTWPASEPGDCQPLLVHQSNTPVTASAPANRGEVIRVFLYGLGQTSPPSATGPTGEPGRFITDVLGQPRARVTLTQLANALSSDLHPSVSSGHEIPAVVTEGVLAVGQTGVYALSFRVPDSIQPPVACGGEIRSNYLLTVTTSQGASGIPVCIG